MLVVLDTNTLSVLQRGTSAGYDNLCARLTRLPDETIFATVVSFEEQTRGWLAYLRRAKSDRDLLKGYSDLWGMLNDYRELNVLPFDDAALTHYRELKTQRVRIGTMDLRIASIALACHAQVVTQNLRDFQQVPGLLVEDWTV